MTGPIRDRPGIRNDLFVFHPAWPADHGIGDLVAQKAPVALVLADKLIEDGLGLALPKALQWECASLELILQTQDARRGLKANMQGDTPAFKGD